MVKVGSRESELGVRSRVEFRTQIRARVESQVSGGGTELSPVLGQESKFRAKMGLTKQINT